MAPAGMSGVPGHRTGSKAWQSIKKPPLRAFFRLWDRPGVSWMAIPVLSLSILALGTAVLAPRTWFVGRGCIDAYGTQWFYWLASRQLLGIDGFQHTAMLFFPWGKDIYLHTGGNLLDAYLASPLRWALGPVLGYNTWILLVLLGNGLAAAHLARSIGSGRWGAMASASLMVICPFVLQELQQGRPTQAFLLFPVLCLYMLIRMRVVVHAVLVGLLMAFSAWTYWYYGLICALLAVVHGLWRLIRGPARVRVLSLHLLAALLCLWLVLPTAWPLVQALERGSVPGLLDMNGGGGLWGLHLRTVEGDSQGLFVLSPLAGTAGALIDEQGIRYNAGSRIFGMVHVGLLLVGLVLVKGHRVLMLSWAVLALLLAVGPVLILGDRYLPNPVYLALLDASDVLRRWWWPARTLFVIHAIVAATASYALGRLSSGLARNGLLAIVVLLVLYGDAKESLLPLESWQSETSPGLQRLACASLGAVIDLPFARDQKHLYLQTIHEKPIMGGMLSKKAAFAPAGQRDLVETNSFLRLLLDLGDRQYTRSLTFQEADRQSILQLGFRYVLVRTDAYTRPKPGGAGELRWVSEWPRLRRSLYRVLGDPVYEDDHLAIYGIDGGSLRCAQRRE